MKYEIEVRNYGERYWAESEIGMVTGLEFDEIRPHTKDITIWRGQTFVELFRTLGFNTNTRWIKFDKTTPYPCMIRCRIPNDKRHWAGFIYYDHHIYHQTEGIITWAEWNAMWPNHRVTSMLQVWISLDSKLNELTDHHG